MFWGKGMFLSLVEPLLQRIPRWHWLPLLSPTLWWTQVCEHISEARCSLCRWPFGRVHSFVKSGKQLGQLPRGLPRCCVSVNSRHPSIQPRSVARRLQKACAPPAAMVLHFSVFPVVSRLYYTSRLNAINSRWKQPFLLVYRTKSPISKYGSERTSLSLRSRPRQLQR